MPQNPLFNVLQGNPQLNSKNGLLGEFERFKAMFKGDPKTQIQQMLNSGQVTQEQYNRAVQMANEFQKMIKGF